MTQELEIKFSESNSIFFNNDANCRADVINLNNKKLYTSIDFFGKTKINLIEIQINNEFTSNVVNQINRKLPNKTISDIKNPRLNRSISKIAGFVKQNDNVLNALSETTGYSRKEVLKLLSCKNLSSMLTVDEQGDWGHFSKNNPTKISIRASLIRDLEIVKIKDNLNATSFFTIETILHEFVHYGRFWNGLSSMIGKYEAGEVFETNAFGRKIGLDGNKQIIENHGWKF